MHKQGQAVSPPVFAMGKLCSEKPDDRMVERNPRIREPSPSTLERSWVCVEEAAV
jgi:hypothetical protein